MPLFLIFIIFNNHSHNTTNVHSSFILHHSLRPVFLYPPHRFFAQQEKNLHGAPSRESNSGLPFSKPTHYQLSYSAPLRIIAGVGTGCSMQIFHFFLTVVFCCISGGIFSREGLSRLWNQLVRDGELVDETLFKER
jgi:hypothetical protein